jgi:hypothetical protein
MHLQYAINLVGAYALEQGDVATQDGEIIGTWTLIHGALYAFTPTDGDKQIFIDPYIWSLCNQIGEWLQEREG